MVLLTEKKKNLFIFKKFKFVFYYFLKGWVVFKEDRFYLLFVKQLCLYFCFHRNLKFFQVEVYRKITTNKKIEFIWPTYVPGISNF